MGTLTMQALSIRRAIGLSILDTRVIDDRPERGPPSIGSSEWFIRPIIRKVDKYMASSG